MLIDWFTVAAQIINFLVLVGLLKYFLYDRIVNAMGEREQRIASRLEEAESREKEAKTKLEEYRQKESQLEDERRKTLEQAKKDADERRRELMRDARKEVDAAKSQWRQALEKEKDSFLRELQGQIGRSSVELLRKALADLAGADLEPRMAQAFVERLENLSDKDKEELKRAASGGDGPLKVQTSSDLPEQARETIRKRLRTITEDEVDVEFERTSALICGIVLAAKGRKIEWSVRGYLDDLERSVAGKVNRKIQSQPKTEDEETNKESESSSSEESDGG